MPFLYCLNTLFLLNRVVFREKCVPLQRYNKNKYEDKAHYVRNDGHMLEDD